MNRYFFIIQKSDQKYFQTYLFWLIEIYLAHIYQQVKEHFKEVYNVEWLFGGLTRPCNWLKFIVLVSSALLKSTTKGELVIPDVFKNISEL